MTRGSGEAWGARARGARGADQRPAAPLPTLRRRPPWIATRPMTRVSSSVTNGCARTTSTTFTTRTRSASAALHRARLHIGLQRPPGPHPRRAGRAGDAAIAGRGPRTTGHRRPPRGVTAQADHEVPGGLSESLTTSVVTRMPARRRQRLARIERIVLSSHKDSS